MIGEMCLDVIGIFVSWYYGDYYQLNVLQLNFMWIVDYFKELIDRMFVVISVNVNQFFGCFDFVIEVLIWFLMYLIFGYVDYF